MIRELTVFFAGIAWLAIFVAGLAIFFGGKR